MAHIAGIDELVPFLTVDIGDQSGERIGNHSQLGFALLQSRFRLLPFGDVEDHAGYLPKMCRPHQGTLVR